VLKWLNLFRRHWGCGLWWVQGTTCYERAQIPRLRDSSGNVPSLLQCGPLSQYLTFSFVAVAFSQLFSKYICVFVVMCRCSPPTVWFVEFWIWQNGLSVHPTFTFTTTCSTSATTSSIVSRCTVSCLRDPLVLIGYFLPTVFVEFRAFTAVMFLQFTVFCSPVFNDFQSHILCCVCRSFLRRLITSCTECLICSVTCCRKSTFLFFVI